MLLRNPEFGNVYVTDTNVFVNKTADGESLVIVASGWPIVKKMAVRFAVLTEDEAATMLLFYEAVCGQLITIIDHESQIWEGFIVTENPGVSQDGQGCNYSTEFEFEGNIIGTV
jgi:hypothetical protein